MNQAVTACLVLPGVLEHMEHVWKPPAGEAKKKEKMKKKKGGEVTRPLQPARLIRTE